MVRGLAQIPPEARKYENKPGPRSLLSIAVVLTIVAAVTVAYYVYTRDTGPPRIIEVTYSPADPGPQDSIEVTIRTSGVVVDVNHHYSYIGLGDAGMSGGGSVSTDGAGKYHFTLEPLHVEGWIWMTIGAFGKGELDTYNDSIKVGGFQNTHELLYTQVNITPENPTWDTNKITFRTNMTHYPEGHRDWGINYHHHDHQPDGTGGGGGGDVDYIAILGEFTGYSTGPVWYLVEMEYDPIRHDADSGTHLYFRFSYTSESCVFLTRVIHLVL